MEAGRSIQSNQHVRGDMMGARPRETRGVQVPQREVQTPVPRWWASHHAGNLYTCGAIMKFLCSFLLPLLFACSGEGQELQSTHFSLAKLADGVFAAIHKPGGYAICNAGIIDLGDKTLVFDTFISPEAAKDLKRAAELLTGRSVTHVVNSHFHNDHIRGNQVFGRADIISTQRTKDLIQEIEPQELEWEAKAVDQRIEQTLAAMAQAKDSSELEEQNMWLGYYKAIEGSSGEYHTTLPSIVFKDTMAMQGTKRSAVLFTSGRGHTESDIALWLPAERILFAGDLLFVGCHPWLGDGFPEEWVEYLGELKTLNATSIVPGHGPIGQSQHIDTMVGYITTMHRIVENAVKDNIGLDDLKKIAIPDAYRCWWFGRFFAPNLASLYQRATGGPRE